MKEKKKAYLKAKGRYYTDRAGYESIFKSPVRHHQGDFYLYFPDFDTTASGRLIHKNGCGMQSCTRAMKKAAYHKIPDVHNIDMKSAHPSMLIQEFEIAGCDPSWLVQYCNTPDAKVLYAARAGMSVECWKACLNALNMGAYLRTTGSLRKPKKKPGVEPHENSIIEYVREECGGDDAKEGEMRAMLKRFEAVVAPLVKEIEKWHSYLVDSSSKGFYGATRRLARGGWHVRNKYGMTLNMTEMLKKYEAWEVKAKLTSFILQGQEQLFIYAITVLGPKYGYTVNFNEHDGCVAIGEVSKDAVKEAAEMAGLRNVTMVEKPFCD